MFLSENFINKTNSLSLLLNTSITEVTSYPSCHKTFKCRTEIFQNLFLPYPTNNWNKLDPSIRCAESHSLFQKKLLGFIRPIGNSIYIIHDPVGVKLFNRLQVGFSYL